MNKILLLFMLPIFCFGQYTSIPDSIFEQRLIDWGYDTIHDGQVLTLNIVNIDSLTFDVASIGDGTSGDGSGGAEVELEIQGGRIIGAKVTNGGFGFTNLPDLTINSESGVGARLLPVLNFTKVQDASKLAESMKQSAITVISCITK